MPSRTLQLLRARYRFWFLVCLAAGWVVIQGAASGWGQPTAGDVPTAGDAPTAADAPDAARPTGKTVVGRDELGGSERYLTHLSTDKPIYRAEESVFVRGVVLHHAERTPLPADQQANAYVEIRGPKGDVVAGGYVPTVDSVLGYQWDVPEGQAGGEYTIQVTYPHHGHTPAQRKFDIRAYRAPRLKTQIEFLRDAHGPGDEVVATLEVARAEGGIPTDAPVTVVGRVDGAEVYRGQSQVNEDGRCIARFQLPVDISRGEGTLAMIIDDGGVVETASKTIPILLQTVDLTLYPEGGELVAGLASRVYFQAWTPQGKPADLAGIVRDSQGKEVGSFRSEHEGRGRFPLTPETGQTYELQITEPAGIATRYPLPPVQPSGAVIQANQLVFEPAEPLSVDVAAVLGTKAAGDASQPPMPELPMSQSKLVITVCKSEAEVARKTIPATTDPTEVLFDEVIPDGVLRVTVTDEDGVPLAERLVFRKPQRQLNVQITPDLEQYVPGGKAKLTVQATDERGKPVEAWLGITVTDDSVLEMIDRREQAPRLPIMVLLENDVHDMADAHVYLDAENEEAPLATDLLLGTQGWRRFAFYRAEDFISEHGDAAMRVLAMRMPLPAPGAAFGGDRFEFAEDKAEDKKENRANDDGKAAPQFDAPREEADGAVQKEPVNEPMAEVAAGPNARDLPQAAQQAGQAGQPAPAKADQASEAALAPAARKPQASPELQQQMLRKLAERRKNVVGFADLADEEGGGQNAAIIRNDFIALRMFAHEVRPDRQAGDRRDFTETLFWHAALKTDAEGKATIEFGLNDAVTSFQVAVDSFSKQGALGSGSALIESVKPFYLEPKLPLEVTTGDRVQIPVGLVNATDIPLDTQFSVTSQGSDHSKTAEGQFPLAAQQRLRKLVRLTIGKYHGTANMTFAADAGAYADQVTRSMVVQPLGFPVERAWGGLLDRNATATHEVVIPEELVPGSVACRVVVYPSPMASMTDALERLIREPYGCFEQTSSTVYPLVMAQQYFMTHEGVDPSLVSRSDEILAKGYERLLGFECKSGGFEWFGQDPGHDALTAYGLMEFTDMAQVRHVDPELLDRTRHWLLNQRDGDGQYKRLTHTLHTWLPEPEVSASYNTWALLEAGTSGDQGQLAKEIAWVRRAGESTDNTYVMALAANVLWQAGDDEGANLLLDRLAGKQVENGSLEGATVSVVGSGGEALIIETTALASLAWLKNGRYTPNVESAMKYLAESCEAGRFGSTQSTILALKAIVAYDQARAKPKAPGKLRLLVDGQRVGKPVSFTADHTGVIELPDPSKWLSVGKHDVQVVMEDGSEMPYGLSVDFYQLTPDSSDACSLHLEVELNDEQLTEGEVTEAQVVVINRREETVPTPLAIIGIPGGLEVRHDQLKELVKAKKIAAYEVRGREVILYWRALEAEQRVELPLSLVAAVPGTYTGPASRAYLYYTDEDKLWIPGLHVAITAK